MKVSILTLGCRVNQSESDIIEGNLKKFGCSIVGLSQNPDYCIVNTCTVTKKSDYQSRQLIRRAVRAGAEVIATGCYTKLRPEEVASINGPITIINENKIYSIINALSINNESITFCFGSRSRPYLKVQDGCNFSCSYCVVPMARGRSISLEVSKVIERAQQIEASGYHEIVLTGIHLGSYGHDLKPRTNLSRLIINILEKTKKPRLRLSSLEITEVDETLIELLQEERICKHIHLPLQSGDDGILKLMNRSYTSKDFAKSVEGIYKKVSSISIGADVIVGFPGEGPNEYFNTRTLIEELPITYLHIFPFSPRPGTSAYRMPMQNPFRVRRERLIQLKSVNTMKMTSYMNSHINKILDIIIEEQGNDGLALGTSSNYLKVKLPWNGQNMRALVRVRAAEVEGKIIRADLIDKL